jgi:archaellum component FlaC
MDVIQQVNSNANKALLWSLLTEEHVFAGLSDSSLQPVVTLFETAIHTTINSYAQQDGSGFEKQNSSPQMVLSTLNKEVIKRVMTEMAQYKPSAASSAPMSLYKSADIQEARIKDITSKVKVLENDMNSLLILKKPQEIDFSDKKIDDDMPIGENMDQLIKDALASRERELELIQYDIPNPSSTMADISFSNKKTVSFNTKPEGAAAAAAATAATATATATAPAADVHTDADADTDADMEIGTIFNKLKRPITTLQPPSIDDKLDGIIKSIHSLHEILSGIVKDVHYIKGKKDA